MNRMPGASGNAGVASPPGEKPAGGALSWAVYLGTSWTWCIGMFLPVILVREMGLAGWLAFAIPNVIGAAAMGWVLRTAESSDRIVEQHRPACIAFSAVTVAFHVFFLGWLIGSRMLGIEWMLAGAGAGVGCVTLLARGANRAHFVAWAALAVSIGAVAVAVSAGRPEGMIAANPRAAIGLAPACILGFALCPYLDLTFHRARRSLGVREARSAFTIGFGGVFLAMILFSLWYAPALANMAAASGLLLAAIGVHMIAQLALTVSLHSQEVRREGGYWGILIGAAGVGVITALLAWPRWQWLGLDGGEIIYRLFLGFYGLIFPAYVWVCMMPWRHGSARARLLVAAGAVLIAAPAFFAGFVAGQYVWLALGVAVVLAAPAALRRLSRL
jgi:hypothetical protein